jgi:hypothetical protein
MKSSKPRQGSPPAGGTPKGTRRRHKIAIKAPSAEAWEDIIRDHKLPPAQERTLKDVVDSALADISHYRQWLRDRPDRTALVRRLKNLTRVLGHLRDECGRSVDLMQHFLPHDALAFIGESLTFSAMSEALERDVFPGHLDLKIERMRASDERITLASLEQATRPMREALGLKHGNLLLRHFIEGLHAPLAKWIELDQLNKGGRPSNAVRDFLMYRLAEAAPEIVGKPAAVSSTGPFVDLCSDVLVACGLSETGIGKAVPRMVSKLRRDQSDCRIGRVPR